MLAPYRHARPALLLALVTCALSLAVPARGQNADVIRPTGKWVTDLADMLSPSEEQRLNQRLAGYADTTSTQIVVVLLADLSGQDASNYATTLGEEWGVGGAEYDNGVVILVSRDDRQMFIATGYGLEGSIPDAIAARIYRGTLVPAFRQGQFYAGLVAAVDELIAAARGEYVAEGGSGGGGDGFDVDFCLFALLMALIIFSSLSNRGRGTGGGRRHRGSGGPVVIWGGGGFGGGGFGGGGGGGGFGGFSGGGGSFGGGGAGGGW